jgi:hypothetical protein
MNFGNAETAAGLALRADTPVASIRASAPQPLQPPVRCFRGGIDQNPGTVKITRQGRRREEQQRILKNSDAKHRQRVVFFVNESCGRPFDTNLPLLLVAWSYPQKVLKALWTTIRKHCQVVDASSFCHVPRFCGVEASSAHEWAPKRYDGIAELHGKDAACHAARCRRITVLRDPRP